jgi:hypothetical protein
VAEIQIQVINLQALHRLMTGLSNMFSAKAQLRWFWISRRAKKNLGGDTIAIPGSSEHLQCLAHDFLGLPRFIAFGIIKKINPSIKAKTKHSLREARVYLFVESDPGAER